MKKLYYLLVAAMALSSAGLSAQCIQNGDFEEDIYNPWKFKHRAQSYTQVGCDIDTNDPGFVNVLPSNVLDQFAAPYGTWVSTGLDPYLAACSPSVSIPRVVMNKYAMKLNVNDGNADVTSMYQYFSGAPFISFNYAFSAQNSHQGDPDHQPFFTARIIDVGSNTIIASFCIKADNTNPIFGTTIEPVNGAEIVYTDWHCETLFIPDEYKEKKLMLEFVVADCGASKDFGTVYLDNVNCEENCQLSKCIENGDFEEDTLDPWDFKHRAQSYTQVGCNMDTTAVGFVGVAPSNIPDQFTAPYGTRVSTGVDPYLAACSPPAYIPRVINNKYAMKLNVNDGNADVTSMSQYFMGAEFITFNFAFSAQNGHQGDPDHQPFFTARIIDPVTGNILTSYCLKADNTDPMFTTTIEPVNGAQILYTDWHCRTLYVPKKYIGNKLLLEFVVADCGASKDFGTVYIDYVNCEKKCSDEDVKSRTMPTKQSLNVYPNPVNDVLTITGAQNIGAFTITDLYGKVLITYENTQKADEVTINVSGLATGVYMLSSDGGTTRIIKN
jgi:Secretion system C-terminal sorting domain